MVIGIHIPYLPVFTAIGRGVGIKEASVTNHGMAFDDIMKRDFQRVARFAGCVVVIAGGDLGVTEAKGQSKRQKG